jgi:cobalt-zinc-cadmium resistance protein CzcA
VLFLGNVRAGLIVASVIPLAMLFAIIMMNLFGVSGNLMSLGALDFGLIVDGAVIIVEAVLHQLHHKKIPNETTVLPQNQLDHEVGNAASKMMNAAVFGQIIILIVYLPILALVGIEGKMFRPMAQTVSFALLGAFLLSLTYVPMITSIAIGRKISSKVNFSDRFMGLLERTYLPALNLAVHHRKALIGLVVLVFSGAMYLMTTLGGEFIPELEEGDFAVDTRLLTGSSLTASVEASVKASRILEEKFPEVDKIVCRIGSSEIPTDPMPVEMGDLIITLRPKETWTSARTYDELANKMSESLANIPGLSAGFQFPVQMRFNELISGARQDVVCKIFGDDLDSLALYANRIGDIVGQVEGASDLYVETVTGLPQIVVEYKREAMALYGANVAEVNQVVRTAFAGESAGLVYESERRFDLVMRLEQPYRGDLEHVKNLLVKTAGGRQVPLSALADIAVKEGPNQIQRENANRRIIVGFNVRGRDVESVVQELQQKVEQQVSLPPGFHIRYGGAFENLQAASTRLMIAVPAALLLIFFLLYFAFSSFRYALLIFSAIPLSAIGGVVALWLRDMPFSISAGVGFIALFGVAVLNGIVLISEFNRIANHGEESLLAIVQRGTHTRLRPVLMTAAVASLGFLPMAISESAGSEVQRPLATVVIGGLITATFLTLIVLPVLYLMFETRSRKRHHRRHKAAGITTVLLFLFAGLQAQQPLTLPQAFELLPAQNPDLTLGKLQRQYLEASVATAGEMPRTKASAELGQTNSVNFDSRFSLLQPFLPFGFAGAQRQVLQAQVNVFDQEMQLRKADLRLLVRALFDEHLFQQQRERELQSLDSLYTHLLQLANQRLQAGETNRLESASLRQQQHQVQQQKLMCRQAMERVQAQLKILLRTPLLPVPTGDFQPSFLAFGMADSSVAKLHPLVLLKNEQARAAAYETELQKAARHPELEVGYNNQSLIGYQTMRDGTEKFYEAGNRFSTAQVGISFPLFGKASKAKVRAAEIRQRVLQDEAAVAGEKLAGEFRWRLQEQQMLWDQLQQYQKHMLPDARLVQQTATQQLQAGELNYINWMMLVEPAFQTRLNYLDKVLQYRHATSQLLYFTESNN